jgi:hypothetical protein
LTKRILFTLLQFVVFMVLLGVGAFWAFVRLGVPALAGIPVWRFHASDTHDFIANGVVFAFLLMRIIVLIQAARKRLRPWAQLTILAFVLALLLSMAMKLGMISTVG